MLGENGHEVDRQPVRMGHVRGNEFHARAFQVDQESSVAAQAIELGDDEDAAEHAAGRERRGKLWPVIALSGLDLTVRGYA